MSYIKFQKYRLPPLQHDLLQQKTAIVVNSELIERSAGEIKFTIKATAL
jgi:hypothetical protein